MYIRNNMNPGVLLIGINVISTLVGEKIVSLFVASVLKVYFVHLQGHHPLQKFCWTEDQSVP